MEPLQRELRAKGDLFLDALDDTRDAITRTSMLDSSRNGAVWDSLCPFPLA